MPDQIHLYRVSRAVEDCKEGVQGGSCCLEPLHGLAALASQGSRLVRRIASTGAVFSPIQSILVGGLEHFLFSHILGIIIPID